MFPFLVLISLSSAVGTGREMLVPKNYGLQTPHVPPAFAQRLQ